MAKLNVDCYNLIFDELKTNKNSLHSCLLVNREWCQLVVPILWKNHAWSRNFREEKLFNIILSCLPSSSKQILVNNGIKLPSTILLEPLLFNYISFCEFPEAEIMEKIIHIVIRKLNYDKRNLLEQEIYKLFVSQCKNIKALSWRTSQPLSLFPGASTCFSQLYSLYIDIDLVNSSALGEMAHICKKLNSLTIYESSQDLSGLISLIDAQRNLKRISLYHEIIMNETCKELSEALARKCNTIDHLKLGSIMAIEPSYLTSFINLKKISIRENLDTEEEINEFLQYLAISEFPDLQSLDVDGLSCFKELAMMIERTKGNISEVFIRIRIHTRTINKTATNSGILIESIANNCPKIETLFTFLVPNDFIHVKSLLLNCRNLGFINFSSFDFNVSEDENIGDELLNILTRFSPKSLTRITISGDWKCSTDSFERFFESCRERTLFEFNINQDDWWYFITEKHQEIVRKYINEGVIRMSNIL